MVANHIWLAGKLLRVCADGARYVDPCVLHSAFQGGQPAPSRPINHRHAESRRRQSRLPALLVDRRVGIHLLFRLDQCDAADFHGRVEAVRIPVRAGADGVRGGLSPWRRCCLVFAETHPAVPANQHWPRTARRRRRAANAGRQL
ncbi:hypothetical protein D3C87_1529870 [compost metagenome]